LRWEYNLPGQNDPLEFDVDGEHGPDDPMQAIQRMALDVLPRLPVPGASATREVWFLARDSSWRPSMNTDVLPADVLLDDAARLMTDADRLCRASIRLAFEARRTRSCVREARRRSPLRRILEIRAGGSDALESTAVDAASRVRSKLARGGLRCDPCTSGTVVSLGSRLPCHGCDEAIPVDEVELRPRFSDGGSLRLHARCFAVWQTEILQ